MRKLSILVLLLLTLSCKQESLGPLNGVLVVYSSSLADFIDEGGLEPLHLVVETVDPEDIFSFSFAELAEFDGTLKERRIVLLLLAPEDRSEIPGDLSETSPGVFTGEDIWAINQQVFAVLTEPSAENALPADLPEMLLGAYNNQVESYIYKSFVATSMTSQERIDSLRTFGFTIDVPKSYGTHKWSVQDGFIQYQRQPDDLCILLFSIGIVRGDADLTPENAMLAREAMARTFFYDAEKDSVDRARTSFQPCSLGGLNGLELTGVWRNPEYLNAGAFTSRVLDAGDEWYIVDMEVYNPGYGKEPYLREGWIIMDTFRKE